ncbi:MAG: siphovirus Gp157 family protein [Clostridia bacterium]|nr:siphovirus Gp157 family protein [Clostridia bacterium]
MYLYDIAAEYRTLFDQLEEMQENAATEEERVYLETAWFDTLDGLDGALEAKAENIAAYVKELKAFADDMRAAEKALADRRHVVENRAERLKKYLMGAMLATDRTKIDTVNARISVRSNAETPRFENEAYFVEWAKRNADDLLRYKEPEIDKAAVKRYLQAGNELDGVSLERSKSLIIK